MARKRREITACYLVHQALRERGIDITEDEVEEIYLKYKDNPLVEIMRQEIQKKMDH